MSNIYRFGTFLGAIFLSNVLISNAAHSLEALEDNELSAHTGAGVGVIIDDLSLFSQYPGSTGTPFELTLQLTEEDAAVEQKFILSELQLYRSDFDPAAAGADFSTAGGRVGNAQYPISLGDISQVSSLLGSDGLKATGSNAPRFTRSALHTEFPGGDLSPLTPNLDQRMNEVADKFNLHIRVDSFISSRGAGNERRFDFDVDLEGFQFYGFKSDIWAEPYYGLAMASNIGIRAETLSLGGDPGGHNLGDLNLNGVDIFLRNGSPDQPLVVSTERVNGKEQLVIEILPITREIAAAYGADIPKSDVRIKSIDFGDPRDPDLRTALRSPGDPKLNGAAPDPSNEEHYHYAFQPDQGYTLELIGLEVQHMKITTLDI